MRYVSTRGFKYASLEDVILNGFAPDGGLYVPERILVVEPDTLRSWSGLTFPQLAFEVLSLFIEPSDVEGTKSTLEGLENHMREALRRYPRVS